MATLPNPAGGHLVGTTSLSTRLWQWVLGQMEVQVACAFSSLPSWTVCFLTAIQADNSGPGAVQVRQAVMLGPHLQVTSQGTFLVGCDKPTCLLFCPCLEITSQIPLRFEGNTGEFKSRRPRVLYWCP